MRSLRFTRDARSDVAKITVFIASESGSRRVATDYAAKIRQRCEQLAALPGTKGRERSDIKPGLRSVAFGNYVIFFRYVGDLFEVVNVLEGHRDMQAELGGDAE